MPELHWVGKSKVITHHLDVPFRVLDRQYSFDTDGAHESDNASPNMIIHGDNLEALKALLPQYEGRVDCIYIDPPYNTGKEGWVYNDNVNDPRIKKWLGDVVGKEGEDLSRHDKWLCMMYPRLRLLQRLLAPTGAIFISIDDHEAANLQLICNEIFGAARFVADIAVVSNLKGRSDDKYVATAHEHLLIYRGNHFETNGVTLPESYVNEYKLRDERGRHRLLGLRKRGADARREDSPNLFYPFAYNPEKEELRVGEPEASNEILILPRLSDRSDGRWRWSYQTAKARIDELVARKVRGRNEFDVFQKDYLGEDYQRRAKPKSVWMGTEFASEAGTLEVKSILGVGSFNTPKPVGIIEYCLQQIKNPDAIVLDSFAGSGTTAHSVLAMNAKDAGNRKFILVELGDYADAVTAQRVRRVISGYQYGNKSVPGTGGSFSFYELGEPLLVDGKLNTAVSVEQVREYIWFTETQTSLRTGYHREYPFYLGEHLRTAYHFIYKPDAPTNLGREYVSQLTPEVMGDAQVIYADTCTLSDKELSALNITFKKIPRDITRL